jgi:hypothetical protein
MLQYILLWHIVRIRMTLPKGFQKRRCPALEHGNQGRNEYEASRRAPRQRQSTGGKKHGVGFVIGTILLIFAMTFTMLFGIFMVYVKTTLAPTLNVDASQYTMDLSSILYYQDKTTGKWKELQTLHGTENRIWVDYDKMPKALWQGAVSIEDKRFFKHHGVDWSRTARPPPTCSSACEEHLRRLHHHPAAAEKHDQATTRARSSAR